MAKETRTVTDEERILAGVLVMEVLEDFMWLPEDEFEQKTLGQLRNLVGVSVREPGPAAPDIEEEHYHAMLAHAADFMVDRYDADLVFVPMEPAVLDLQQAYASGIQRCHLAHSVF